MDKKLSGPLAAALLCVTLAGCGGGDGGDDDNDNGGNTNNNSGGNNAGNTDNGGNDKPAKCANTNGLIDNAGPDRQVKTGSAILLDGTASRGPKDADPKTYKWSFKSRPDDSNAKLSDAASAAPNFTADKSGKYEIQLNINGIDCDYARDTVLVTASGKDSNSAPQANAGPDQSEMSGMIVKLNGSESRDADGDKLAYDWSFKKMPDGNATSLVKSSTPTPSFTPDAAGTYVVQLVVSDGEKKSKPDTVNITVAENGKNNMPNAVPGSYRAVVIGDKVELDGSKSKDPDGDSLSYNWRFATKPKGSNAKLSGADTAKPTFTADKVGTYPLLLTVNDGTDASEAQSTIILAVQRVNLFVEDNNGDYQPLSPQTDLDNVSIDSGAENATLNRFRVKAVGGPVSIGKVTIENKTGSNGGKVDAYFDGIKKGDQIKQGETQDFDLGVRSIPNKKGVYPVTLQFVVSPGEQPVTFKYKINVTDK